LTQRPNERPRRRERPSLATFGGGDPRRGAEELAAVGPLPSAPSRVRRD